jgi:CheY-like chemotaxis protein/signal transduction histidine kinase
MRSTAAAWGPLSHQLENVRVLSGLRRIVLAWQDPQGEWKHVLRCRDDMVPQAEVRLLDDLFHVYRTGVTDKSVWQHVLQHWHADTGWFETFKTDEGGGFYAAFCESGLVWPEHTLEWMSLALPALAASANESERHHSQHLQRQAVLESAASLAHSESEPILLQHAIRLARRLFGANASAWLTFEQESGRWRIRCLAEDPEGSEGRAASRANAVEPHFQTLAQEGKPLLVSGRGAKAQGLLPPGASLMAVPLRLALHPDSALALWRDSGRAYTSYDQSTLSVFVKQVEGVLENQRLMERLKAANLELTTTQAQLVESARLQTLGEVASSVAHDFNNVLGALLGRVQLMQHGASDASVLASLGKMERVIADGENTVKRLQEAARHRLVELPLTLDALVQDVFSTTESVLRNLTQIHDRKVVWITELLPTAAVIEKAQEVRSALRQLLTDISTEAPVDSVIELRTRRQDRGDLLTLTVATDPGRADELFSWQSLPGFLPFSAALEKAGGRLTLEAQDGISSLNVSLEPHTAGVVANSGSREVLRVLVVDDDEDVRDVLTELLLADGHSVQTALDGADALKQFVVGRFDIVFTDLGMPGISGWQVAEHIKRESPGLPVVMVTGWGHQLDPAQIERSGVDRVLTKPFQWGAVRDTLRDLAPQ